MVAPKARQAFLLVSVEGFSAEETGEVLTVGEEEVIPACWRAPPRKSRARWRPTS